MKHLMYMSDLVFLNYYNIYQKNMISVYILLVLNNMDNKLLI